MAKSDDQMAKIFEKIEVKLENLDTRLDSVDRTLIKQEANLGEHMRRTELAERNILAIDQDLKPIKKHVAHVEGALKFIGLLGVLIGIASGILKLLSII